MSRSEKMIDTENDLNDIMMESMINSLLHELVYWHISDITLDVGSDDPDDFGYKLCVSLAAEQKIILDARKVNLRLYDCIENYIKIVREEMGITKNIN